MSASCVRLYLLLLFFLTSSSMSAQSTPVVDAAKLGTSPTIYLNTWRFHMGASAGVDSAATPKCSRRYKGRLTVRPAEPLPWVGAT